MKKITILFILFNTITALIFAQTNKKYSPEEVKADLKYMYETLEISNYNLFSAADKNEMDNAFNDINNSITDSLNILDIYRVFQPFVAKAGQSHCYVSKPWTEYLKILKQEKTFFPATLHFSKGKVYVKKNYSDNNQLSRGDEVLSFNGIPIKQFMTEFLKFISGPSDYFKLSTIELYSFPRHYWIYYGKCENFDLQIKKPDGHKLDVKLNAISGNKLEAHFAEPSDDDKEEREFYVTNNNVSYLRPGKFLNIKSNENLQNQNTFNKSEFCTFIDSAFAEFNRKKSKDLIIDLRDNQGGDNAFSDYMIAYFANKPFRIASTFKKRTSKMTKKFWKEVKTPEIQKQREKILSYQDGAYFDINIDDINPHEEKSKRFNGKVYVLVNRNSYSNAAYVAALIQDYNFGTIIGEETAEEVTTYVPMRLFRLPNSKSLVSYPSGYAVRPGGDSSLRGVVPDHIVSERIFTDKDEVLEYTIKYINGK